MGENNLKEELHWQYRGVVKFEDGTEIILMGERFKMLFRDIEKVKELIEKDKKKRNDSKVEYYIEKQLVSNWEIVK